MRREKNRRVLPITRRRQNDGRYGIGRAADHTKRKGPALHGPTGNILGEAELLPRPWDIASCRDPSLSRDVWQCYEQVVAWFNHEYVWDPTAGMIPPCWPNHPHVVHELAVLADQRRRVGISLDSNGLEEWHRYTVPAFLERLKHQTRGGCDNQHTPWPAQARATRHDSEQSRRDRYQAFRDDLAALESADGAEASQLFLEQMIVHHEGAVEMAQTQVDDGSNPDAVELAQTIIDAQTAEIQEMQDLLATL